MSNRNAASLTGLLLVRKGAAAPSPLGREAGPDAPTPRRFTPKPAPEPSRVGPSPVTLRAANDKLTKAVRKNTRNVAAAKQNGKPRPAPAKARSAPSGGGPSAVRRFTLRLSPEQHLLLRLASVHLGRSGQKLLLVALDEYLDRIAPELREGNCACLLDGVVGPPPRGRAKGKPA